MASGDHHGVIDTLQGRILDLDSHLQFSFTELGPIFGELADKLGRRRAKQGVRPTQGLLAGDTARYQRPDVIDETTVWTSKGAAAPGANDAAERLRVLDLMGIDRQLIFPMVLIARIAWTDD